MLRSHNFDYTSESFVDIMKIHIKPENANYERLITPLPFIPIGTGSESLIVPGSNPHTSRSALEDTRHAILDDHLAKIVLGSMEFIDGQVDDLLSYETLDLVLRILKFKILYQIMMPI